MVGLVEYDHLDVGQHAGPSLDEIDEPPGRRNHHVDATFERGDLLADRHASGDDPHLHAARVGKRRNRVADLHRELAGRDENQPAGPAWRAARPFEPGDQRQPERERLAGAGGGAAEQVAPGQHIRDGRCLDRERRLDSGAVKGADQAGREAQVGESGEVVGGDDAYGQVVPNGSGSGRTGHGRAQTARTGICTAARRSSAGLPGHGEFLRDTARPGNPRSDPGTSPT